MNLGSDKNMEDMAKETFYRSLNQLITLTFDPSKYEFKLPQDVLYNSKKNSMIYFDTLKNLIK